MHQFVVTVLCRLAPFLPLREQVGLCAAQTQPWAKASQLFSESFLKIATYCLLFENVNSAKREEGETKTKKTQKIKKEEEEKKEEDKGGRGQIIS